MKFMQKKMDSIEDVTNMTLEQVQTIMRLTFKFDDKITFCVAKSHQMYKIKHLNTISPSLIACFA